MKLIYGDCLEKMKDISPDGSIDLVLTDPFYILQTQFNWKMFDDFYWDFNEKWIKEIQRILKENFHFLVSFASQDMFKFEGFLLKMDFDIKSRIVWNYRNSAKGTAKGTQFAKTYEFIWHCSSGKKLNFSDKWDDKRFDVQKIAIPQSNFVTDKKIHQYQKPLKLYQQLVEICSIEGETVLDPFMGSGTTGVACKNLNRDFIGIELDEKYFEIAKQKIEKSQQQILIEQYNKPIQPTKTTGG